jgi:hypothetical protein
VEVEEAVAVEEAIEGVAAVDVAVSESKSSGNTSSTCEKCSRQ